MLFRSHRDLAAEVEAGGRTEAEAARLKAQVEELTAEREAEAAKSQAEDQQQPKSQAEIDIMENPDLTEEQKQELMAAEEAKKNQDSESEVDEIEAMIEREENEHKKAEKEAEEKKLFEEDTERDKIQREERDAAKLEAIRENERDLLDKRSQPIRQYLMDKVVPHLTEGLINLCKETPDDPTDFLANFLLKRADELDEELIRQRDDEIRRKAAERNGTASRQNSP